MSEIKKPHASPKDFFMHLLAIVALYITAINLGVLLFQIINFTFPDQLFYFDYGFTGAIRWSIASMIVALPTFIISSRLLTRDYQKDPEKKNLRIRNWLIYLTIFGTAVIMLVDLMSLIYQYLGGEITTRFALKALTVLYISALIFAYYLYKVKVEKEKNKVLYAFMSIAIISIVASIVMGFYYIGSPKTLRAREFDQTRINDLTSLSSAVQSYYYQYEKLPQTIDSLTNNQFYIPVDPQTGKNYEYNQTSELTYEVCATFNLDKFTPKEGSRPVGVGDYIGEKDYKAGRNCFTQRVTPAVKGMPPIEVPVEKIR